MPLTKQRLMLSRSSLTHPNGVRGRPPGFVRMPFTSFAAAAAAALICAAPAASKGMPVAPVISGWAAGERPASTVSGYSQIDGDANSDEPGRSSVDLHRDVLTIAADRTAFTAFQVTWRTATKSVAPRPPSRRRLVGRLFITTIPDPAVGLGSEDEPTDQTPTTVETRLWLDPGPIAKTLTFAKTPETGTLDVRLRTGPRPKLAVAGLPVNTVSVDFQTAGPIGVALLAPAGSCSRKLRTSEVAGTDALGNTFSSVSKEPNQACLQ